MKIKDFFIYTGKSALIHWITYLICGLIFSNLFDYKEIWTKEVISDFFKPYDSNWMFVGVLSQPVRGFLLGVLFWFFRDFFKTSKYGFLKMWGVLVIIGIIGTPAASPGSLEGVIYSKLPLWFHLIGMPEILTQTLIFSFLICYWDKKNEETNNIFLNILKSLLISLIGLISFFVTNIIVFIILKMNPFDMTDKTYANLMIIIIFISTFLLTVISVYIKKAGKKIKNVIIFTVLFLIYGVFPFILNLISRMGFISFAVLIANIIPSIITYLFIHLFFKIKAE